MRARCFVDYTCAYSFRSWRWLGEQVLPERPDLAIEWSGFSLKEVNREDGASVFEDTDDPRLSVLALALAEAARAHDLGAYQSRAFEAFHSADHRVTRNELLQLAETAGVDSAAFWRDRKVWIEMVAAGHAEGVARWGIFGTPTLVLEGAAVYLKLGSVPSPAAAGRRLWDALETLVVSHPDLVEIKRPTAPAPAEPTSPE